MIKRDDLSYNGGAPKEEIEICLNCPLAIPKCETDLCPLVIARIVKSDGQKKREARGVLKCSI